MYKIDSYRKGGATLGAIALFSAAQAFAQWTFTPGEPSTIADGNGWAFNVDVDNGTDLTITGCAAAPADRSPLDFSAGVTDGYAITKIGSGSAILGGHRQKVSTLTLPDTVKSIVQSAFFECSASGSLIIPDSVESLGNGVFASCAFDGTLTLGKSLKTVGDGTFANNAFTGALALPDSLARIGRFAFRDNKFESISSWGTLTTVPQWAFAYVTFTTNRFELPEQITDIEDSAFSFATFAESVIVGDNVTDIWHRAFRYATMTRISLPSTGVRFWDSVFMYATVKELYYRGEYPERIEADHYGDMPDTVTTIVKTAHVASWNVESENQNIQSGVDFWQENPIICTDWDWDVPIVEGPSEMWLKVGKIQVSPNRDVILTWKWAQVEPVLGETFRYEVYTSTDLAEWELCPSTKLPREEDIDRSHILGADTPASDRRFFKVKAVKG